MKKFFSVSLFLAAMASPSFARNNSDATPKDNEGSFTFFHNCKDESKTQLKEDHADPCEKMATKSVAAPTQMDEEKEL